MGKPTTKYLTIFTFNRFNSYAYGRNGFSTDLRRTSTTSEEIDDKTMNSTKGFKLRMLWRGI